MRKDEETKPANLHYRTPELTPFSSYPEHLHDPAIALLEAFNRFSRILSQENGWDRDQRESHSHPQLLCSLLSTLDQGAAITAARKFLESFEESEEV
jgi:hypothetical protein